MNHIEREVPIVFVSTNHIADTAERRKKFAENGEYVLPGINPLSYQAIAALIVKKRS